jgi:hypothetical protein
MRAIGAERSSAEMASAIAPLLSADTRIVAIRTFPLSLPFYLQRTLVVSTDTGRELTSNFVAHHFDDFRNQGAVFLPLSWWPEVATECARPVVFIASSGDHESRAILEARMPLVMETRKYVVYGPCGLTDLALDRDSHGAAPRAPRG